MISAFPFPFPDELFYSLCARYAWRVGYPSLKSITSELFGVTSVTAIIDLPSGLGRVVSALPPGYSCTVDGFIDDKTIRYFGFMHPFSPLHA